MVRCVHGVVRRSTLIKRPSPWRHFRASVRGKGARCDPYLCGNLPWTVRSSDSAKNWIDPSRTEWLRRQCVRTAPPSNVPDPVGRSSTARPRSAPSPPRRSLASTSRNQQLKEEQECRLGTSVSAKWASLQADGDAGGDGPPRPYGVPALVDAGLAKSAAAAKPTVLLRPDRPRGAMGPGPVARGPTQPTGTVTRIADVIFSLSKPVQGVPVQSLPAAFWDNCCAQDDPDGERI
jgi:hypothetical protein